MWRVIATGATLVVKGEFSVGAMIGANILASRALMPITRFAQLGEVFAKARQSLELIREFTRLPLEPRTGSAKSKYSGALELRDVAFAFPNASGPLFESVNLSLAPGAVVVVTGGNGTGKTTMARILVGLLDPTRGQIFADGLDLRQAVPEWVAPPGDLHAAGARLPQRDRRGEPADQQSARRFGRN